MAKPGRGFPLSVLLTLVLCAAAAALTLDALRGPRAPRTAFTVLGADPVQMDNLLGRPLIVNFWATTCSICRREMPKLADLYRDLHPRGLELIGVAMPYDPPNLVAAFVQRSSLPYPVSLDIDARIVTAFGGVTATPTTFLISPEGRILRRLEGRIDFPALRRHVLTLLPRAQPGSRGQAAPAGATAQLAMLERP